MPLKEGVTKASKKKKVGELTPSEQLIADQYKRGSDAYRDKLRRTMSLYKWREQLTNELDKIDKQKGQSNL